MDLKKISVTKSLMMVFLGLSGLLVTLELSIRMRSHEHGHGPAWMATPGFFLIFGILGAIILAIAAKLILFPLLKRDEDYYAEPES